MGLCDTRNQGKAFLGFRVLPAGTVAGRRDTPPWVALVLPEFRRRTSLSAVQVG